jgi:hypothetical protein
MAVVFLWASAFNKVTTQKISVIIDDPFNKSFLFPLALISSIGFVASLIKLVLSS